ncbi:hypothetical protein CDAR_493011 [Caerostris darwini]|uniref:Uncharacterized protein n=1 Tax=Caerostris darwini TaxID=1538125 RepID=A0AAV4MY00_9ARAC|nr:hypothetical protein CDAR_493011 [Caerostris darwini]
MYFVNKFLSSFKSSTGDQANEVVPEKVEVPEVAESDSEIEIFSSDLKEYVNNIAEKALIDESGLGMSESCSEESSGSSCDEEDIYLALQDIQRQFQMLIGKKLSRYTDKLEKKLNSPDHSRFVFGDPTEFTQELDAFLLTLKVALDKSDRNFLKYAREIFYNIRRTVEVQITFYETASAKLSLMNQSEINELDLENVRRAGYHALKLLQKVMAMLDTDYKKLNLLFNSVEEIENVKSFPMFSYNQTLKNGKLNEKALLLLKKSFDDLSGYWTCIAKHQSNFKNIYARILVKKDLDSLIKNQEFISLSI